MQLKKKLVAFVLAATMIVFFCVSVFATTKFDTSVFTGRDDISITYDDMTAITKVYSQVQLSGSGQTNISFGNRGIIMVIPYIGVIDTSYDSLDVFTLQFDYFGYDWVDLDEIYIKIGNNRYCFSNCYTSHSTEFEGLAHEIISFNLKNEAMPFIQDFIKHSDEEIKVRINGDGDSFDFVLTEDMKNSIILLYNLFVKGGGTRKSNLDNVSQGDQAIIMKNNMQL